MRDRRFDPYNDDAFWDEVMRDSDARRADPLPFALEALEDLFRYESDVERGFVRWQRKLEGFFWWADDAIHCLEQVMPAPPPDLGDRLRARGISIWVQTSTGETIGDSQVHVDWLLPTTRRLRDMFEHHVATRTAEMKAAQEAAEF